MERSVPLLVQLTVRKKCAILRMVPACLAMRAFSVIAVQLFVTVTVRTIHVMFLMENVSRVLLVFMERDVCQPVLVIVKTNGVIL